MGCNSEGCSCSGPETTAVSERKLLVSLPKVVNKGWGYELHIHNEDGYCGKVLHFNEGAEMSMHYHVEKRETWYVAKGRLQMKMIDPDTAQVLECMIEEGHVIDVYRGIPHQLHAIEESDIFEVSTPDKPEDSYRVWTGDSQK